MNKAICSLLLLILSFGYPIVQGQNISSVDVENLSNQQIEQIVSEMNSRNLSIDEAAALGQAKGMTQLQIDELKRRIIAAKATRNVVETNQITAGAPTENPKISEKSAKTGAQATEQNKKIYGFQLFNSDKLTFEPSVNIPAPENYVLGLGDQLLITVWGASQQTYLMKLESSGAITLPDVGPVYILGIELSKAKDLIRKRLAQIYKGMEGPSPNTFAEVSLTNIRSIKVNVVGEAIAPGTYTLPATASAFNALFLSGGPNENGSFREIQVIRDNKIVKKIDVYDYLVNAKTDGNIQLREQDMIYIPTYKKRVEVSGSFKRNGLFELTEKDRLADLIRYAGGFTDKAYKNHLSLTRITDKDKKVIDIDGSVFDSFIPNNADSFSASDIVDLYENRVAISGAVFRPGIYELTEGLTLSGLIKKAQGVNADYFSQRGLIIRLQSDLSPSTISFDVAKVLKGETDIPLQREDQVIIQDIFSMRQDRQVKILGEVRAPGDYQYTDNMTLKDLVFNAGGLTEAASESTIELARRRNHPESNDLSEEIVKLFHFSIDRALSLDNKADTFHLMPFDYVYVRKAPSYHEQRTVYIRGEVKYPGAYSIGSKNDRISDLIARAGGVTPEAFLKGTRMKRTNPMAAINARTLQYDSRDSLLDRAKQQINNDQLEIKLEQILKNPGSDYDYLLKEGDEIIVPETQEAVWVTGEIQNPIGMAFENGKPLKYYINRSGGFSSSAKKGKTFVIYSDGTTKVSKQFIWRHYPSVEPGSQIIIPSKPEKTRPDNTGKWLAIASTITTILVAISRL